MEISGGTTVFGILADPIAHVRTPQVVNARLAALGADAVLVPFHVSAGDLPALWDGLRRLRSLGGLVVTVPHKGAVPALADACEEPARLVGAANVVRRTPEGRMICTNFDGTGFVAGLRAEGIEPAGRRALLAGAGGAGAAIAFALAAAGVTALTIANRGTARAADLAGRVAAAFPAVAIDTAEGWPPSPAGYDLVVNATSLGLHDGDPLPVDADALAPDTTVAEAVMKPEITTLLARARAIGCAIHLGRHMLDRQVELILAFLGVAGAAPGRQS